MKNLKELKFTTLDASQMKQVKGGGLLNDTIGIVNTTVNSTANAANTAVTKVYKALNIDLAGIIKAVI
ncbi:hypothetical protein [Flavobacterium pectinovorum]|jgi:hypothetical protein|uniref:Uncharacterized protein n=1 Tax=Flavobacterium pectinovorum TaxID=29533 RepID=A0A502ET10_9FLAO|nr:hypothetical protein [Flavobacterium pectinovorum]TPG40244.1 hypothetical protein EAH81_13200 [Flavobacterium pectinovorum]